MVDGEERAGSGVFVDITSINRAPCPSVVLAHVDGRLGDAGELVLRRFRVVVVHGADNCQNHHSDEHDDDHRDGCVTQGGVLDSIVVSH